MQNFNKKICTLSIIITLVLTSCTNKISENDIIGENDNNSGIKIEENSNSEENLDKEILVNDNNDEEKSKRVLPALESPISDIRTDLLATRIEIILYYEGDQQLIDECFELIDYYESILSRSEDRKDTSEIYKLNSAEGGVVTLSDDTIECLQYGIDYSKSSNGAFDITIGALSSPWMESQNEAEDKIGIRPTDKVIEEAIATIDYNNVVINGNEVYLTNPDTKVDLGGIAKGYIADKVADYIREQGVETALLNLGGNVLTIGSKADDKPFVVAIQEPVHGSSNRLGRLAIYDQSVVSSGDYERFFYDKNDGNLYPHILDTTTGFPVVTDLAQATIISHKSITGDGLSTAVYSLGSVDGLEYVENIDDVEAILVKKDGTLIFSSGIGKDIVFAQE